MHKGLQRDRFLPPQTGIPTGKGGDGADRCIDQHPTFTIGEQSQAAAGFAAELNHSFCRTAGPTIPFASGFQIGVDWEGLDQHQAIATLFVDHGSIRRQFHAVFG